MKKRNSPSPILLSLATLLVIGGLLLAGWVFLNSLPTRELARFPAFVQELVIAAPESAVLPTVAFAEDAAQQLAALAPLETTAPTATPPPVVEPAATEVVATATAEPTPTATATPAPTPLPGYARISNVNHYQQTWNNCGPATTAMALSIFGQQVSQEQTATYLKPNEEDRNVTPGEIAAYVNGQTPVAARTRVNGSLDLLRTLLAHSFPVIIEIGLDPPGEVAWLEWYGHYLLVAGYDDAARQLWVYDSLIWEVDTGNSPDGRAYSYDELANYWPHFNNTYIVLYDPAREAELAALIGNSWDDTQMWQASLIENQRGLQAEPENAFFWFNMGTALNALGRSDEATTAFDKARSIGLPWRMLWYQFGPYEAYYATGRYIDIVLLANTTLNDRPFFEESFYWRGRAQERLGDLAAARSDFEAAMAFNPNFAPAAEALQALGN